MSPKLIKTIIKQDKLEIKLTFPSIKPFPECEWIKNESIPSKMLWWTINVKVENRMERNHWRTNSIFIAVRSIGKVIKIIVNCCRNELMWRQEQSFWRIYFYQLSNYKRGHSNGFGQDKKSDSADAHSPEQTVKWRAKRETETFFNKFNLDLEVGTPIVCRQHKSTNYTRWQFTEHNSSRHRRTLDSNQNHTKNLPCRLLFSIDVVHDADVATAYIRAIYVHRAAPHRTAPHSTAQHRTKPIDR